MFETPDAGQNIITRGLPKTGQRQPYGGNDDGVCQAGWWVGRENYNNRQRWILKIIAFRSIVFDRATGLMWAANGNAEGCNNGVGLNWNDAIDYCNALDFAGFTDWRLPNAKELMSIVNYGLLSPAPLIDEPPFMNTVADNYWTSTTFRITTTSAYYVKFSNGVVFTQGKINENFLRAVRGGV